MTARPPRTSTTRYELVKGLVKGFAPDWVDVADVQRRWGTSVGSDVPEYQILRIELEELVNFGYVDRRLSRHSGRIRVLYRYLGDIPGIR